MKDVKNPSHYAFLRPEPIDIILAWGLDYCRGCALKYIARAGRKNGNSFESDLTKAIRYLEFAIENKKLLSPTDCVDDSEDES